MVAELAGGEDLHRVGACGVQETARDGTAQTLSVGLELAVVADGFKRQDDEEAGAGRSVGRGLAIVGGSPGDDLAEGKPAERQKQREAEDGED